MNVAHRNHFDAAAGTWDAKPQRIELINAVGKAILRQTQPNRGMDVLDYGCGTGLLGLYLLPHVRSVTGADSSPGMLKVLQDKIRSGGIRRMQTQTLDLERDAVPESRYHLIVANMVLHHVKNTDALLKAFYRLLHPGGILAVSDLDAEQGLFHSSDAAESVHHHGFDRNVLKNLFYRAEYVHVRDETAHVLQKPIESGEMRNYSVFLMVGHRDWNRRMPQS